MTSDDRAGEERIDELEEQLQELGEQYQDLEGRYRELEAKYEALGTKHEALKEIVLGDLRTTYDDVMNAPSLWNQIDDVRSEATSHGDRLDRLDSSGARGQPGAARVTKIRHALVRRASSHGTATVAQAQQGESAALDYEDVLALFDYEISRSYATKLLDKAASEGDNSAFWLKTPPNPRSGRKTLRVDLSELDSDSSYMRSLRQDGPSTESPNSDFRESGNTEHSQGGGTR